MVTAGRIYRLLIVDDDAIDGGICSRLLTRRGPDACEIRHAADGAAGLAALRAQTPDCLLLDFNLPDMTGFDFLTGAETDGALPCAVVLITGHGSEAIAVEAMKRGVQDYLVKDRINESNLWRSVTTAITQTELRQRLADSLIELTAMNAALEQEATIRAAVEAELRAAKETADIANKAKSQFLAMVTHELRTPLNGILGYARLLQLEGGLNAAQRARVDAMLGAGDHLLQLINGVLDFAAIEADRIELRIAEFKVLTVAMACLDLIRPAAEAKGLELSVVVAPDTPERLITDRTRLQQVLLNLLNNAVKFTPTGSVTLCLARSADSCRLRIEVVDTGPGIPADQLQRLFQDFERFDNDATRQTEGTGLGLALTVRLVTLMGGQVGHMENPSGPAVSGSLFWLELPLPTPNTQDPATASVPDDADARTAPRPVPPLHVLVVDDILMNLEITGSFLRTAGHKVVCVESGAAAVAAVAGTDLDVVLMDVRMPGMDGLEATRRIRALEGPRGRVPIVALTAQVFAEQIAACREAGMDSHLAKPFDLETLLAAVQNAAGSGAAADGHRGPESKPVMASAGTGVIGADVTDFDPATFEGTVSYLTRDAVASYLQTITQLADDLLRALHDPDAPSRDSGDLAEAAHKIAGSAGMFGFERLAVMGRRFERAARSGADMLPAVADGLRAALAATLQELAVLLAKV